MDFTNISVSCSDSMKLSLLCSLLRPCGQYQEAVVLRKEPTHRGRRESRQEKVPVVPGHG